DRAGRGPVEGTLHRTDRCSSERPIPASDRRQPHGAAAPADSEGDPGLELRPVDGTRTRPAPAPLRVRGRLYARGSGSSLRLRRRGWELGVGSWSRTVGPSSQLPTPNPRRSRSRSPDPARGPITRGGGTARGGGPL